MQTTNFMVVSGMAFILIVFIIRVLQTETLMIENSDQEQNLTSSLRKATVEGVMRKSKLADGCEHVYLDLGGNIGVQTRKLFEPHLYHGAAVIPFFDRLFGPIEERLKPGKVCAFSFEANPIHEERLNSLQECYTRKGYQVKFFVPMAALNDDNKTLPFYLDDEAAAKYNHWGSTLFGNSNGTKVDVQTVHIGRFIMDEIVNRLGLDGQPAKGNVYVKLDIEGAEYQVMGGMLTTGALCHITEASIEFHPTFLDLATQEKTDFLRIPDLLAELATLTPKVTGCKSMMRFNVMDDESFLTDEVANPLECPDLVPGFSRTHNYKL